MPIYDSNGDACYDSQSENFTVPTAAAVASYEDRVARSKRHRQDALDSFDRCDTDGFLSQWASNMTSDEERQRAELNLRGGLACFWGLFSVETGKRVPAKIIETKFGHRWAVCDASGKFTGEFLPVCPKRASTLGKKGYFEARELAPAIVKLEGRGMGLSGTCWVATVRTDGGYPGAPKGR